MLSLDKDLQQKKNSLEEFKDLTLRILQYLPNVLSDSEKKRNYIIYSSNIAGTKKHVRPINETVFIFDPLEFQNEYNSFLTTLNEIKAGNRDFDENRLHYIDKVIYTIQQSIGAGLDLLVDPNSARKHVGNRFEELIKILFTEIGIANKKISLKIPYESEQGEKKYTCENDIVLSPFPEVISNSKTIHPQEIVVSVKTTSKDRMGKMFIDKLLLEKFVGKDLKVIGIFLNDVQRKNGNDISYTLVSGLFMVYTSFLTRLDGIYYLDSPPNAHKNPYNNHIGPFSRLITKDIWSILSS